MKRTLIFCFMMACAQGSDTVATIGVCDLYAPAEESLYILPYRAGEAYSVLQTNCNPVTHFGPQRYAYDFTTPKGTPLVASRAGTVIQTYDPTPDLGWTSCESANKVRILHDDGTVAEYMHLKQDSIIVEMGQQVSQGQEIAASGNSGCTGGSAHLHFVVWVDEWHRYGRGRESVPVTFANASPSVNWHLKRYESYTAE